MKNQRSEFGRLPDGRTIERIEIASGGLSVAILGLGAIVQDVRLHGIGHSLTLGSDDLKAYLGPMKYFGALVGPVANRIAHGKAPIGKKQFAFQRNENGKTTLHGGESGTHGQVWDITETGPDFVAMQLVLPDGAGGFPGNRLIALRYRVSPDDTLEMDIKASTDRPTLMNLANHSYWNLTGEAESHGHRLAVSADHYLPTDRNQIPTGQIAPVAGTPFDFREPRGLGAGSGPVIDHTFCLDDARGPIRPAARLTGANGVSMTLETTEPGLQVYDASGVSTSGFAGHGGAPYGAYCGVALEAQGWPDAPNHPNFPPIELNVGETYHQRTRWVFDG